MKMKMNTMLAKVEHESSSVNQMTKEYAAFFKTKQGAFRGEKNTYAARDGFLDKPEKRGITRVTTTVQEKNDSYTSPFSTWTNGYLTKVRLNNDNFEFYHDWWIYGWISFDKVKEKYPCAACKIEFLINYLIK